MSSFLAALSTVGVMLFYAVPGFLLVKSKLIKSEGIPAFAKLLMYVCSPMLVIYSFLNVEFSWKLVGKMAFAFCFAIFVMIAFVVIFSFVFKKKSDDARYRIYTLATVFPNCAFMGVPVLQAVLPQYPEALAFSVMFSMARKMGSLSVNISIINSERPRCMLRMPRGPNTKATMGFSVPRSSTRRFTRWIYLDILGV